MPSPLYYLSQKPRKGRALTKRARASNANKVLMCQETITVEPRHPWFLMAEDPFEDENNQPQMPEMRTVRIDY
ncbi:hypothetical protein MGYG_08694 [Nannizzia gypsea CBS 118893]|uniref:Uncharacterized protein n=1 Tax=Arthroderma gypseum (strain ATCC MYA-4604 / CBS 118893) TaxID=535722 RepID=E4V6Q4_ARTGP|nr:hypothetical protein MGYG_08694 [Nannizzia gypsea CBS 118893]EFQ96770.1 hypothetical protein MGYG_08694 [Nannizzia gypsea CBS 118893]